MKKIIAFLLAIIFAFSPLSLSAEPQLDTVTLTFEVVNNYEIQATTPHGTVRVIVPQEYRQSRRHLIKAFDGVDSTNWTTGTMNDFRLQIKSDFALLITGLNLSVEATQYALCSTKDVNRLGEYLTDVKEGLNTLKMPIAEKDFTLHFSSSSEAITLTDISFVAKVDTAPSPLPAPETPQEGNSGFLAYQKKMTDELSLVNKSLFWVLVLLLTIAIVDMLGFDVDMLREFFSKRGGNDK